MDAESNISIGYLRHLFRNPENNLIAIVFNSLAKITPLVLRPSERLPGPSGPAYNRLTLAVRFSVRFRVARRKGDVCLD
jgi:hypothetical protein